ncbi:MULTISPECIES: carbon-nitrogen hydrolase family protein [unclassified Brevundimonas]|uniref:carbon-nitrogen hydrolase family protein n=1 Tax=unclassified Brevundimonas TaxID=2622653 RepID=UPI000CFC7B39|nr:MULTISPECIES: carbon-nitrogen hydrolase family protein [unclassified Brevundimonas]PRA35230.1 amidohydrolase [Brevundimonas sp. MYb27]PQZ83022.1 amidohydrolase [Brevundimonas sp. MYb31]PRB14953.1 amidohydrolase [Brevundimonas sp. MYb52]PRB36945.1 amidohydrolase [Brevundimonas sp. MYb46]PRB47992.1 amidohydrolase [Brevundimonas sp. MYb33]
MDERLEVALIQTRTPATASAGLAHVEPLIREAAAGGAQLVLTPEGTNFLEQRRGLRDAALSTQDADAAVLGLRALASELGVWLLIGSAIVRSDVPGDARAANRSLLIDPTGAITARYDKLHVFDVDLANGETYRESASVRPGDAASVAATPWGRLGLSICYDVRFPHLYRALAKSGASMIAVPAAFTRPTGEAHWETLLRARAIETGAFVLAPAQGGTHEDGRQTWGRSLIIGPWGEVIARADHDEPGVLHARLDLSAVDRARASIPALRHDRDFDWPS